jgi:L-rhamnose 1-dehydrogenase
MQHTGKVAIVTGASRGIGRGIAARLAADGATVVVNYVSDDAAARDTVASIRATGGEASAHAADVSQRSQVDSMIGTVVDRYGRLDIMVNNAGICPFRDFLELDEDVWDQVLDVNLKGTFLCSQAAARVMVQGGEPGRIIAISSISAIGAGAQQAHYCASKAGQDMLMKCMALQLGPHGITCNSVAPGVIATDINRTALADPAAQDYWHQRTPVGRVGRPEDVAGMVSFLASEDAAFITGSFVVVDGGVLYNLQ